MDPKADDSIWNVVYRERVFYDDGFKKGKIEGHDEGRAEGLAEGMEKGEDKANRENARRMKADGMPAELIAKYTGLTLEVVNSL